MKKMGFLFACALATACGGASKSDQSKTTPAYGESTATPKAERETTPSPSDSTYASRNPTMPGEQPTEEPSAPPETTTPEPAPAPEQKAMMATAELKNVKDGSSMGTITFERDDTGKVTMNGQFTGLKGKSVHALYIHEKGDCGHKGKNVGKHLNPTSAKHGEPSASMRHAGDFGNVTADESGNATFSMETDSVTMEEGRPDSILNRAVVLHAKKDDKKGSGGEALACGVITLNP
jgi:Cu-Zn family superoxide dismutase